MFHAPWQRGCTGPTAGDDFKPASPNNDAGFKQHFLLELETENTSEVKIESNPIKMDQDQKKCGGISALGIIAILVSSVCIAVGIKNVKRLETMDSYCEAEPKLPYYLVVAGLSTIILLILRLIIGVSNKHEIKLSYPINTNPFVLLLFISLQNHMI